MSKSVRKFSGSNRRRWPRLDPSDIPSFKSVTFNQGSEVQVIDISRGGMLLETEERMRPQMKIMLKLVTGEGVFKIAGRVLRSKITSLKGIPRYQSAVVFDQPFHKLDEFKKKEPVAHVPNAIPGTTDPGFFQESAEEPPHTPAVSGQFDEFSAILTVVTNDATGASLHEMFKLNDW